MNTELLFSLYRIHAKSGSEKKMRKFLRRQALLCGAQSIETDKHGNVLIVKGHAETYPCLAAHMDQVQSFHSKDFEVVQIGDDVLGWSRKSHSQQGLGADDKNGLFICLECLKKYDNIKVAFFSGEEIGCVGSRQVDLEFFKDCRFIIEPDRAHGSDLITSMSVGRVCSDEFVKAICAEAFGYSEQRGSITDVGELVERGVGISCLNLSCGYYDAHTDHEMTILPELENCLDFVQHIIENCTDVYPFSYEYDDGCGRYYPSYGKKYTDSYTPKILDYYHGPYSDPFDEDEDYEQMQMILETEPNISFREVCSEWGINFHTRDMDVLRYIYDDVKMLYNGDTADDDFWGEDEELQGELVFPSRKVS